MRHIHFDRIDSTQKEAWRMYEAGTKDVVITASIQTDGIGTHGRKWYTDEKNNIALSLLLTPNTNINKFDDLTIKIAQIIVDIFNEYNCNLYIKEPNDLMFNDKKIGGILLQTKVEKNYVKALVLGIGININQVIFNDEIKNIASSISKEFNVTIDINDVVNKFLIEFRKELIERKII